MPHIGPTDVSERDREPMPNFPDISRGTRENKTEFSPAAGGCGVRTQCLAQRDAVGGERDLPAVVGGYLGVDVELEAAVGA